MKFLHEYSSTLPIGLQRLTIVGNPEARNYGKDCDFFLCHLTWPGPLNWIFVSIKRTDLLMLWRNERTKTDLKSHTNMRTVERAFPFSSLSKDCKSNTEVQFRKPWQLSSSKMHSRTIQFFVHTPKLVSLHRQIQQEPEIPYRWLEIVQVEKLLGNSWRGKMNLEKFTSNAIDLSHTGTFDRFSISFWRCIIVTLPEFYSSHPSIAWMTWVSDACETPYQSCLFTMNLSLLQRVLWE
jgi:hypothetical protein